MMRRLTRDEVLSSYRVRSASSVSPSDPRLGRGYSVALLHSMTLCAETAALTDAAAATFVEWPDTALGTVFLDADDEQRACNLVAAYEVARHALEQLALHDIAPGARPN